METTTTPIIKANKLEPIANKQRIQVMDLLRGFALIGIIFMNIEWFNRPLSELVSFDLSQTGGAWATSWLVKVFIEGKFYKLFSILFGMGFAVMLINAQQAGRPFGAWFIRRMLALFLFGMAHMLFFWGGDIIHDYAVAGLFLLGFVYLLNTQRLAKYNQPKTFANVAASLILAPLIVTLIAALFFGSTRTNEVVTTEWKERTAVLNGAESKLSEYKLSEEFLNLSTIDASSIQTLAENSGAKDDKQTVLANETVELSSEEKITARIEKRFQRKKEQAVALEKERQIFARASYWEVVQFRIDSVAAELSKTPAMAFFVCMPLFMIGYWLVASEKIKNPEEHTSFFNVLCWGGLGVGLVINIVCVFIMLHPATQYAREIQIASNNLFFYGQYILCLGYIGLFVKLSLKPWFIKGFSWLAPLGKMALTNYISHSIILSSLFYGYAGAMFGQVGRAEQVIIVVLILLVQVVFCHFWLKVFRFGPLEWLWRSFTYLKWQPLKVKAEVIS